MPATTKFSFPTIDQVGVEARAAKFTRRSLKGESKLAGLELVVSMIDLTTLEGKDTPGKIATLCGKALQPMDRRYGCPPCAAVCVYPNQVASAKQCLGANAAIGIASVATAFPAGQIPLEIKLAEVEFAVAQGATEIDMVIDRGAFLCGDLDRVSDEIAATRAACGDAHLKVIFETGELGSYDDVRRASEIAMRSGAHFIKTSTGIRIGMKPAGGIRTAKESLHYLAMVKETLGDAWLTSRLFRFGASSLLTDVTLQIAKAHDGNYQSADDFSLP